MDSSSTMQQEIQPEDFKLSIEKGKHLVAPFESESQQYACQCVSCSKSHSFGPILPRLCIAGVICPLLWLGSMALCLYLRWGLPADPKHPPIAPDQLPTYYELGANARRTEFKLDPFTLQDIRITNRPIINTEHDLEEEAVGEIESADSKYISLEFLQDSCRDPLQKAHYLFIKHVATQVIDTHQQQRSFLAKWLLLSTAALATCVLILATVLGTTVQHS